MRSQESRHSHAIVSLLVLLLASAATLGLVLTGAWADAQEPPSGDLPIIALGDGYTAGVGGFNGYYDYYLDQGPEVAWVDPGGVSGPGKNCYQNFEGYPWRLRQLINTEGFSYAEVWLGACIGATIDDLAAQAQLVPVEWWRTAQLVLISAGGDDIGFSEILTSCVALSELDADCDERLANAESYLRTSFSNELETALNAVMERAPQAQLGLVGYPNFADPTANMCGKYGSKIAELHQLSESVMSNLAAKHDNWYAVSVSEAFAGHGPCAAPDERWVSNLLGADEVTSCDYLAQIDMEVSCESFYPNGIGNTVYSDTLYASDVVAKVLNRDTTPTPVPTPSAPECSGAMGGTQSGLTNVGFETGDLSGWTVSEAVDGVCVTGADLFTAPYEGTKMARLGNSYSDGDAQPVGRNEISQTFVVTDPIERFAYNLFTYDYLAFDEFRYTVEATTQGGVVISTFRTTAWGDSSDLKSTGWHAAILDLSAHVGEEVTLTIWAEGTGNEQFPFWAYIDSGAPPVAAATVEASSTTGTTTTDLESGKLTVVMPSENRSDLTLSADLVCIDGTSASAAFFLLGSEWFEMELNDQGAFTVTIDGDDLYSAELSIEIYCDLSSSLYTTIGELFLYDPIGVVTDAVTGEPISGATVTLYRVPGWTPGPGGSAAKQCQSDTGPWTQPAPTELGRVASRYGADYDGGNPQIEPDANPLRTNSEGQYGWELRRGCWYVVVEAEGYVALTSPVVGTPPAVTALDLALEPLGDVVPTPTPSPTGTATPTFTPTPGSTPTPGPSPTPISTPTPGSSPTPGPSPTPTPQTAKIVVTKLVTSVDDEPTNNVFAFTGPDGEPFELVAGGTETFEVTPGAYSLSETVGPGWVLSSVTCSDGSDPSHINVSVGETVTCTFRNAEVGDIGVDLDVVTAWEGADGTPVVGDGIRVDPSVNASVGWIYTVTNTGKVPLDDIVVMDDVVGRVACPGNQLLVGDSMVCTMAGTVIVASQGHTEAVYRNNATVTASAPDGASTAATASSSYVSASSGGGGGPATTQVPSVPTPAPTSGVVAPTPVPLQPGASRNAPTTAVAEAQPLLNGSTPAPTITPSPAKRGGPGQGGLAITGSSFAVTLLSGLWLWIAGVGLLWIGNQRRNR